jgi:hypothetical protein
VTVPKPALILTLLEDIRDLTREIGPNFRWAHDLAHSAGTGDDVKVSRERSDPTLGVVVSKERVRAKMRRAAAQMRQAHRALVSADRALESLFNVGDDGYGGYPGRMRQTPDEMENLRAAKRRREGRGEGYGLS